MSTRSRDPPPPITAHLAAEGAGRVLAAAAAADAGYRLALVDVHTLARVHVLQETLDTTSRLELQMEVRKEQTFMWALPCGSRGCGGRVCRGGPRRGPAWRSTAGGCTPPPAAGRSSWAWQRGPHGGNTAQSWQEYCLEYCNTVNNVKILLLQLDTGLETRR